MGSGGRNGTGKRDWQGVVHVLSRSAPEAEIERAIAFVRRYDRDPRPYAKLEALKAGRAGAPFPLLWA